MYVEENMEWVMEEVVNECMQKLKGKYINIIKFSQLSITLIASRQW